MNGDDDGGENVDEGTEAKKKQNTVWLFLSLRRKVVSVVVVVNQAESVSNNTSSLSIIAVIRLRMRLHFFGQRVEYSRWTRNLGVLLYANVLPYLVAAATVDSFLELAQSLIGHFYRFLDFYFTVPWLEVDENVIVSLVLIVCLR